MADQHSNSSEFSILQPENLLIITSYGTIILISLVGNVLVCCVVLSVRTMRTTTNLLIVSQSFSDIIMTLFNIPFNVIRFLPLDWPFGDTVCILLPIVQTATVYVSSFTMMHIALHRLWTIRRRRPTRWKTSKVKFTLTVVITWIVALALSLPHGVFNMIDVTHYLDINQTITRCAVQHPQVTFNFFLLLTLLVLLTQYAVPLLITWLVYVKISRIIVQQGKMICRANDEKCKRQCTAKRKRIFMLALAVAAFAICWAPIHVYLLLVDLALIELTNVFIAFHWLAMSSVCYNPIIYCCLHEKFRNGARQSFHKMVNIMRCIPSIENQGKGCGQTSLESSENK